MKTIETDLPGVLVIEPQVFGDERGFFMETYRKPRYEEIGINEDFVQDNLSYSQKGVLRGLHLQNPKSQGKLVSVLQGEVFDVAVDVRACSPHFGRWIGVRLSSDNKRQLYVPPGFAHGFCVTSDVAMFVYKCTEIYSPENEISIQWNDLDIGIKWPIDQPSLSAKDLVGVPLKSIPKTNLVPYLEFTMQKDNTHATLIFSLF